MINIEQLKQEVSEVTHEFDRKVAMQVIDYLHEHRYLKGVKAKLRNERNARNGKLTLKAMILNILMDSERGLNVYEIIDLLKIKYEFDIQQKSLSSNLSYLKREGSVKKLLGNDWKIGVPMSLSRKGVG